MFNLLIDSERVELSNKSRLQLSRLVLDIGDISKRGIKISNALTLPFTKKNDRLTGYPSRLNSNNDAFEVNASYVLTEQNNIISTGDVVIKSFDEKKGIKIQLAEGYGFWNTLGKSKMNDLDLFEYDVTFNSTSFTTLSVKTASPFLWGLTLDSGDPAETALNHLQYSRPQYRYRIIIDKIVEQAGFTLNYNDLFNQTPIDDVGFLSNSRDFVVTDYKRLWANVVIPAGDVVQASGALEFSLAGNTLLSGNDLINQLYQTSYAIKGTVNAPLKTTLSITHIGAETITETVNIPKGLSFINFRSSEIEINNATIISVANEVIFENLRIYTHLNESDIVDIEGDWKGTGQKSILDGFQILTDYNLPSLTQHAFLKAVIKMFFLKVDVDVLKSEVMLDSFTDTLSTNNAIDLTGKSLRFPPYASGKSFGQLNRSAYNNEDTLSDELGRTTFNIDNDNAKPSKDFVRIDEYSASKETFVSGNTTVTVPIYTILSASDEASRDSIKDRILIFKTGVGIPFTATFSDLGWNILHNDYYSSFVDSIERERMMSVEILLTFLQFNQLNKMPIIYLGELNSYFLVLKTSGFEEGEFSKLSLAKFI